MKVFWTKAVIPSPLGNILQVVAWGQRDTGEGLWIYMQSFAPLQCWAICILRLMNLLQPWLWVGLFNLAETPTLRLRDATCNLCCPQPKSGAWCYTQHSLQIDSQEMKFVPCRMICGSPWIKGILYACEQSHWRQDNGLMPRCCIWT